MQIEPIRTARMTLRPLASHDREEFVRIHESAEAIWAPWIAARDPGVTWSEIFDLVLEMGSKANQLRLVGTLADGRFAGFFSLAGVVGGCAESAFADWRTDPELLGQGFGTEGVLALLDLAFAAPPMPRARSGMPVLYGSSRGIPSSGTVGAQLRTTRAQVER